MTFCAQEADLIRKATAAVLAGRTLTSITRDWRFSGIAPSRAATWTRVSVMKTLTRWRNAAVVAYKDEPLRDETSRAKTKPYKIGQWEPIVSTEDLLAVRTIILAKPGTKRVASRLCSGIARCGCGEYMIATGSNGARGYMCSARVRGIAKPGSVHAGIQAALLEALVRDEVVANYFTTPVGSGAAEAEAQTLSELHARRAEAGAAIARLAEHFDAGTFKAAEIGAKVARRRAEIDNLDSEIARLVSQSAHAAMLERSMASLWSPVDPDVPWSTPNDDGTEQLHIAGALIRGMMRTA